MKTIGIQILKDENRHYGIMCTRNDEKFKRDVKEVEEQEIETIIKELQPIIVTMNKSRKAQEIGKKLKRQEIRVINLSEKAVIELRKIERVIPLDSNIYDSELMANYGYKIIESEEIMEEIKKALRKK